MTLWKDPGGYGTWLSSATDREVLAEVDGLQRATVERLEAFCATVGILCASRMVNNPNFLTYSERELLQEAHKRGLRGSLDLFEFDA